MDETGVPATELGCCNGMDPVQGGLCPVRLLGVVGAPLGPLHVSAAD